MNCLSLIKFSVSGVNTYYIVFVVLNDLLGGGCSPKKKPVATPKSANWHLFFFWFFKISKLALVFFGFFFGFFWHWFWPEFEIGNCFFWFFFGFSGFFWFFFGLSFGQHSKLETGFWVFFLVFFCFSWFFVWDFLVFLGI